MGLDWKYIEKKAFYFPVRIVYITLPRESGKTELLLDGFMNELDSILVVPNLNIATSIQRRLRSKYHLDNKFCNDVVTIKCIENKVRGRKIDMVLVDEFCHCPRLLESLDFCIASGVKKFLCIGTYPGNISRKRFREKYFSNDPGVHCMLFTAEDLGIKINVHNVSTYINRIGLKRTISEFITGGVTIFDIFEKTDERKKDEKNRYYPTWN